MAKITYQYRGIKAIPFKWVNGCVVEYRYEPRWYDGSEEVEASNVKTRVKDLSEIVDDYGKKKYRNIQVN